MRHWVKGTIVAVAVGTFGATLAMTPLGTKFELDFGLQWLFHLRGPQKPPPEVAVVAINSDTGRQLNLPKMPSEWDRSIHIPVLERLVDLGAEVIVFNMDLNRAKHPEHDQLFASKVAESQKVVLFERVIGKRQPIIDGDGQRSGWYWTEEQLPPLPIIAQGARGIGPFPLPKIDERLSQFWTFKTSAGDAPTLPAVALQFFALKIYPRWREILMSTGDLGTAELPECAEEIQNAEQLRQLMAVVYRTYRSDPGLRSRFADKVSLEADGSLPGADRRLLLALNDLYGGSESRFVNFYGTAGTIPTYSYESMNGVSWSPEWQQPPDLSGKIVFIGYSDLYDPDQPDRFYTAFTRDDGVDLSGVEIAATTLGNLLQRRSIEPPVNAVAAAIPFAFGFMTAFAVFNFPALLAVPAALVASAVYTLGAQYLFNESDLWFPIAIPLLIQLPFALLVGLLAQYMLERSEKLRVGAAVGYYLPENVAKDLLAKGPQSVSLNRVVYGACFATDMAGFSTIAESLSPQELADFMNEYFEALAERLRRYEVSVTEFRADAIMCAWTADRRDRDVNRRAALAALEARDAVSKFSLARCAAPMALRVGIDVGWVYVGHAGGGGHFVYSIVGDTANTASRIEGLNKRLGTQLLATSEVTDELPELLLRPLGRFVFVGKRTGTAIVELVAEKHRATEAQVALCARFADAMTSFSEARWVEAVDRFEAVLEEFPQDQPAQFFRDLCRSYAAGGAPAEDPTTIVLGSK